MEIDFWFLNWKVVNVYSGGILNQNVAVFKDKIVYVGASKEGIGLNTQVVDVQGDYIRTGSGRRAGSSALLSQNIFDLEGKINGNTSV